MGSLLKAALRARTLLASTRIAVVVGTVLNLLNYGPDIASGRPVSWLRLALNYVVPFCVASYSAARNELARRDGDWTAVEAGEIPPP